MSVIALDHVQLAAAPGCELQARRFFGALLGLLEIEKPPQLHARGGVWLSLRRLQLHIGVERAGGDALAERLAIAGASVTWDEALPNERRLYTEDPFGNRIELLSAP